MPGIIGNTQATGVSKTAHAMTDRGARATAIAQNISNNTSAGQARDLLTGMRDTLRAQNNGDETLLRLIHTTKTDQQMAFQSLNKKWGNSTRTLETKAALIAEFDKAGWDTSELKAYLDPKTTRADRILANEILTILENASVKAETEGPDFRFDANETTNPWPEEITHLAPDLGAGTFGSVQKMKFNGEPMAVKTLGPRNFQPVILDPLQSTAHINRDKEVTAAFLKAETNSVIQPKYFLVQVKQGDQEQQLMVKGGKEFKEWAKSQLWEPQTWDEDLGDYQPARPRPNAPEIKITGLAMPLAQGTTLDKAVNNGEVQFSQTATSAMESLKQLARHGFVHGDIKPANLISTTGGDLKLIDTGSMAKMSKKPVDLLNPRPSDSFDKSTRPYTPHFSHPGHQPDFKKVGMEQDLFSMGVTLLETKLRGIAKTLGPDQADDFEDAANRILNTIKKENDAPNEHSADTIRSEIQTQLEELKSNYPENFADGQLNWAEGVVGTALDQTKPVVDREGWKNVLTNLRVKVPVDSADRQQVLARLQSIGCNSPVATMQRFNNMRAASGSVTEDEKNTINEKMLGGGNAIFSVLYEKPDLLDPNLSAPDRERAFFVAFDPQQVMVREKNLREIESNVQELIQAGDLETAEKVRQGLLLGVNATEEANRADIVKSLADPAIMATFQKFQAAASQNQLTTQDAMAALRSQYSLQKINPQKFKQDLTDFFANRPLGRDALSDIQTLFPPPST